MHEMDTVARREHPAKPTSGLDAKRVADMSRVSAKALDDLWQRAMKNSPRGEGLRDNNLRKAAQRIVKEIRARRNPISFDGTEFVGASHACCRGTHPGDRATDQPC
jgi:hypothetical protein